MHDTDAAGPAAEVELIDGFTLSDLRAMSGSARTFKNSDVLSLVEAALAALRPAAPAPELVAEARRILEDNYEISPWASEAMAEEILALPGIAAGLAAGEVERHSFGDFECEYDDEVYTIRWADSTYMVVFKNGKIVAGRNPCKPNSKTASTTIDNILTRPDAEMVRRGAELMREAAAKVAEDFEPGPHMVQAQIAAAIRAIDCEALVTDGQEERACPHGSSGPCSVCGDIG